MRMGFLPFAAIAASLLLLTPVSYAADECKSDADCKQETICVLAVNLHVCKPPQAPGSACVRDAGCASKKCDIPAGKSVGACK
jgi:Dickkopf N-terminal cysteine-rich region